MDNKILFTENQKFKQWWLWAILLAVDGFLLYGFYKQTLLGQPFGDRPMSNTGQIIAVIISILVTLLFYTIKLQTIIKEDGIYYRFFPIHKAFRKFTWDKIKLCFIRKYNPITEYGGWGLRFGLMGMGKAINISGNKGLQLVLTTNSKILIGTNKPEEINEVLSRIGQIKEQPS